jgi:hypothetical protein
MHGGQERKRERAFTGKFVAILKSFILRRDQVMGEGGSLKLEPFIL